MLDDLSEQELAELDKMMSLIDPFLRLQKVDWLTETKEV